MKQITEYIEEAHDLRYAKRVVSIWEEEDKFCCQIEGADGTFDFSKDGFKSIDKVKDYLKKFLEVGTIRVVNK